MSKYLSALLLSFLVANVAFAHSGFFPHAEVSSEAAHLWLHIAMSGAVGMGVFLLGWAWRRIMVSKKSGQRNRKP